MGLRISEPDRRLLEEAKGRHSLPESIRRNARIILKRSLPDGTIKKTAEDLDCTRTTVKRATRIYREGGTAAILRTASQTGRRRIAEEVRAKILELGQQSPPLTIPAIAKLSGVSWGTVSTILRPHAATRRLAMAEARRARAKAEDSRPPAAPDLKG
jgi:transposase-like protein